MRTIVWLVFCGLPSLALADLLPPGHADLVKRMIDDYDRADQFCAGKMVDSACVIPGSPFEGGGEGKCRTFINKKTVSIDSLCIRREKYEILRAIPDGYYRASDAYCEKDRKDEIAHAASPDAALPRPVLVGCGPTSTLSDRFCRDKAAGDACAAEVQVGNSASSYPGRCMERQEETFYSRTVMTRTVLLCLPENPVVIDIKPSSPPNWLQRLIE